MSSFISGVGRATSSSWVFLQRATASIFHSPLLAGLHQVKNSPNYPTQNYPTQNYPTQNYPTQNYPTQNYPKNLSIPTAERSTVLQNMRQKNSNKNATFYPYHEFKNVTDTPSFEQGLACDISKRDAFQTKAKSIDISTFRYIANNTNPNYLMGIFRNIFHFFSTGTLNQNCVFCSKAVDKNLAALEQGRIETFWIAQSTGKGTLPQNVQEDKYRAFVMRSGDSLSSQIMANCRENSRNIIMVPVKNRHFSHAMNLVTTNSGTFVIDGQSGRVYDLSSDQGKENFDRRYGQNHGSNLVQIYDTGNMRT